MPTKAESRRIRALRPPKTPRDPWRPIDVLLERERGTDGELAQVLTVFLTGRECPFTCVFCDLWQFTLDEPTPPGAIPAQIQEAIERKQAELEAGAWIKLYNASNFFESGAVPESDDAEIARQVARFDRVIVECHPRLVGRRCLEFAERLEGRLQVAMGLETVHPEALPLLGKQATLDDFRRAAARLAENEIGLRAFVLVGAPRVPNEETVHWAERSARFAFAQGAEHVALIPVRGGNGEMERLERQGLFTRPTLDQVEEAVDRCLDAAAGPPSNAAKGVVTVDTWDLAPLARCPACTPARLARLERLNLSGEAEPAVACEACAGRATEASA